MSLLSLHCQELYIKIFSISSISCLFRSVTHPYVVFFSIFAIIRSNAPLKRLRTNKDTVDKQSIQPVCFYQNLIEFQEHIIPTYINLRSLTFRIRHNIGCKHRSLQNYDHKFRYQLYFVRPFHRLFLLLRYRS